MDGRDGAVVVYIRIPSGLKYLAECYQKRREITTLNKAVLELLETHPEIRRMEAHVLDNAVIPL